MTQYQSDKIKIISFLSIILVLYIHSSFHDYPHEIQGMLFNHYLQVTISQCLGQCAVPMFFAISGYLFFLGVKGVDDVWKKMNKRVGNAMNTGKYVRKDMRDALIMASKQRAAVFAQTLDGFFGNFTHAAADKEYAKIAFFAANAQTGVRNPSWETGKTRKNIIFAANSISKEGYDQGSNFRHGRRSGGQPRRTHRGIRNHLQEIRGSVRPRKIHAYVRHDQRPDPRTADARGNQDDGLEKDRRRKGKHLPRNLRAHDRSGQRTGRFPESAEKRRV